MDKEWFNRLVIGDEFVRFGRIRRTPRTGYIIETIADITDTHIVCKSGYSFLRNPTKKEQKYQPLPNIFAVTDSLRKEISRSAAVNKAKAMVSEINFDHTLSEEHANALTEIVEDIKKHRRQS